VPFTHRRLELLGELAEQPRANHVGGGAGDAAEQKLGALGVVVQLREQVCGQVPVLEQHVHLRRDDAPHLLLDRQLRREHGEHRREELAGGAAEHRFGEPLLGAEVVVHQRVVDPRLAGDLRHAGARRSAPREDDVCGVEDRVSLPASSGPGGAPLR
jgi:hypothetical protein